MYQPEVTLRKSPPTIFVGNIACVSVELAQVLAGWAVRVDSGLSKEISGQINLPE